MRWTVHGQRYVYQSPWMNVALVDVVCCGNLAVWELRLRPERYGLCP